MKLEHDETTLKMTTLPGMDILC